MLVTGLVESARDFVSGDWGGNDGAGHPACSFGLCSICPHWHVYPHTLLTTYVHTRMILNTVGICNVRRREKPWWSVNGC